MTDRRTPDTTLIEAVRILSRTIQTDDGVIPASLAEVATRLAELVEERRSISTLLQKVESLEEKNKRLREERRWVSVGERLPPVGQDEKVLVAWRYEDEPKEEFVVSEAWHLRLGLFLDKEEFEFPGVKFWQPLPPGPEGDA